MEELRRGRRPIRREFDNLYGELEVLLRATPVNEEQVIVKYRIFSDNYDKLVDHDNKILEQLSQEKLSEEEEDKEYDEIRGFKELAETLRVLKEKVIPSRPLNHPESYNGESSDTKVRNFKLPKVEMKKFSGKLLDWLAFWSQFQKIDEDPVMHGSDKLWYLLDSLEKGTDAFEIASGYPLSNENYPKVIEALKKRYGNEDLLLQVYIRELLNLVISNVNTKDKIPLKTLYLKLDSHLRALKSLNLEKADTATWLFPLVESSLPETMLYNWQRSLLSVQDGQKENPTKTRLDQLMAFVEKEVEIRQRIEITRSFTNGQQKDRNVKNPMRDKQSEKRPVPTMSSFHVGDGRGCVFCGRSNHVSGDCFRANMMTYEDKMKILKDNGLCYRCCGQHIGRNCDKKNLKCSICQRRHYAILCREMKAKVSDEPPSKRVKTNYEKVHTTESSSNLECSNEVVLQTLRVKIVNGEQEETVRAFIDSGSQRSYILKSTAERLRLIPIGNESVVHSLFGGSKTSVTLHPKYEIIIRSLETPFQMNMEVRGHGRLCGNIPLPKVEQRHSLLNELRERGVSITDTRSDRLEVQLLIGADWYAKLITGKIVNLDCGAIAIYTKLGWTLMGPVADTVETGIANLCLSMAVSEATITQLWELETLGISETTDEGPEENENKETLTKFQLNVTRTEDGRYSVYLPWKRERGWLPSNREVAFKRLQSATKKVNERGLFEAYDLIFREWEKENIIERISPDDYEKGRHYVPHRPVVKIESVTTPVRPVFDASCRVGKRPSLNDCLVKGENLIKLIPELLLRFREKRVAFVADIRKAFQMIGVHEDDREYMRFLWWENKDTEKVIEFRHARVMFGATCSPFILGAVLEHHLKTLPIEELEMGEKLLSTFYVDNCISSEETVEDYERFREKATELMSRAKMDLRMWLSNIDELENDQSQVISVLGMQWDRKRDELFISVKRMDKIENVTKRVILSTISKLFDPMGFICPAILPMKLLLQQSWLSKRKWDEEVPETEARAFLRWYSEVESLTEMRIPRLMTDGIEYREKWTLHTFVDGSKVAYAAAIFLRIERENYVHVQLLAARSRVAPVKPLTIPRLELMGCLIGARLMKFVKSYLGEEIRSIYWSDSTTALAWIRRENQWGTFVANRVKEIVALTGIDNWRHVPGADNPADLPSRGCLPSELTKVDGTRVLAGFMDKNQLGHSQ